MPLTVGQAAVVENLQEDVEDVGVRLFDFVEEDHGVRAAAHRFGELAAFLEADVSRRRAEQTRDGVLLLILGHVDANERAFVVEEILRQCARELGLADAGRSEEDERADRPIRIGESRARAQHCFGDGVDGFVLPDDAPVQLVFEVEQLLLLAFEQLGDRNAGPARDHAGDVVFVDLFFRKPRAVFLREAALPRLELLLQLRQRAVAQLGDAVEVVLALGLFDLDLRLFDLIANRRAASPLRSSRIPAHAQLA